MEIKNREIKEITTPAGHIVKIKSYLTAREVNALKELIFKNVHYKIIDGKVADQEIDIPGSYLIEQEKKALEICLFAIDDKTENLLETILDFKPKDYEMVVKEVNEITGSIFQPAK